MSNRKPIGNQTDTIARNSFPTEMSFDLKKQDIFVTSLAVDFIHYRAMPSPIGQKDRGDYRRSDDVDTITSNGMIYRCAGVFSATMTDNSRRQQRTDGGLNDPSEGRLVLPRFYNKGDGQSNGDRIYLMPGDRLYYHDKNADVKVPNYQKMDFEIGIENVPMFPIVKLEEPIIDSRGISYKENVDFEITCDGNVKWLPGGQSPGIDPDTGKGRIYSIRYLYKAYWYIIQIPKEVRITNVTTLGVRSPERMPEYAIVVREYVFHSQNKGEQGNQLKSKTPERANIEPVQNINPNKFIVPVDMDNIAEADGDND